MVLPIVPSDPISTAAHESAEVGDHRPPVLSSLKSITYTFLLCKSACAQAARGQYGSFVSTAMDKLSPEGNDLFKPLNW